MKEISKNRININTLAWKAAIGIGQIANASEDLSRLTDNLQLIISQFKLVDNNKLLK